MDFPLFHLDTLGNRLLIAVIASVHVLVNHMLAVGAMPLVTLLEYRGWREGDERWDRLAHRLLLVCFVVTTSLGALTGVGIWFSTSLVNPAAIGSLIRIFFWAWFVEWLIFCGEVALILVYFLSWRGWGRAHKKLHIGVGVLLSLFSWLTMAIIVAILGFQMDTGVWTVESGLRAAVLNPLYLPQLAFRTPFAMVTAGMFALLVIAFALRRERDFRPQAVRFVSLWILAWAASWAAGAIAYWRAIPAAMSANLPVALGSLRFAASSGTLEIVIVAGAACALLLALWGLGAPRRLPVALLIVPFAVSVWLLSYFERVREFVRKPDVIASYMYSNAVRHQEFALLAEEGLLSRATYAAVRRVDEDDPLPAGREMFRLACTRCHTTHGVNGVVAKLEGMYGPPPWEAEVLDRYLATMHNARTFMPPLPGSAAERGALAAYLQELGEQPRNLPGAQTAGVRPAAP